MEIKVEHLTKKIRGTMVLEDINLESSSGHIYGIVGKNGSGKTMLLRAIAGLIQPTDGKVLIDDQELNHKLTFPPDMGMIIEKPEFLNHLTGLENLKLLADIKHVVSVDEIRSYMEQFDLDPNSKKTMRKYSLGMKQKIAIIQAIMEKQQLLILDEPFNALDEATVEMLYEIFRGFRDEGRLLILTSHHAEDIEQLCDNVCFMENGKVKR